MVTPQVNATPVGVMPRLKAFNVVGLFEVGMADYDRGAGFMHMADAARLMRLGNNAEGVRIKLEDMFQAPLVAREIAYSLDAMYQVSDWTQAHRNFFAALRTEKRMMTIILFLIVAVAAFNIVSTLVMVSPTSRRISRCCVRWVPRRRALWPSLWYRALQSGSPARCWG